MGVVDRVRIGMTKKKFIGCSGSPRTLAPIAEVPDTRYLSMRQHRISFQALGDGPTGQGYTEDVAGNGMVLLK